MKKLSAGKVNRILRRHQLWLDGAVGGKCAHFHDVDLRQFDFVGRDLRKATFVRTNLVGASFRRCVLNEVLFQNSDLSGADLSYAQLVGATFETVNLNAVDFGGARLYDMKIYHSNLYYADLRTADMSNVHYDSSTSFLAMQCPEEGSFVGWKAAVSKNKGVYVILKVLIPEDALRTSGTDRECWASKITVLDIQDIEGNSLQENSALNLYDFKYEYKKGETAAAKYYSGNRWDNSEKGIHFWITREEALRDIRYLGGL